MTSFFNESPLRTKWCWFTAAERNYAEDQINTDIKEENNYLTKQDKNHEKIKMWKWRWKHKKLRKKPWFPRVKDNNMLHNTNHTTGWHCFIVIFSCVNDSHWKSPGYTTSVEIFWRTLMPCLFDLFCWLFTFSLSPWVYKKNTRGHHLPALELQLFFKVWACMSWM